MVEDSRRHPRDESLPSDIYLIEIQSGLQFHPVNATLVDCSVDGMKFLADLDPVIRTGETVLINTHKGDPPVKSMIEGEIIWVREESGRALFGCRYLNLLEKEKKE